MKTLPLLLALALAAPAAAQTAAPDTMRWTVLMSGRHAGVYKHWTEPGGELRYFYEFNDRGRGPRTETRLRLGADGLATWWETTGHDYYKNPFTSTYRVENGVAKWDSRNDKGEARITGPALYGGGGGDDGLFVRTVLANGGEMAVLPEGRVKVARVGELQVSAGGKTRTVVQYEVSGMGFEPWTTWLTSDGKYFGSGGGWSGTVEAGWEDALPQLVKAQDAREAARYEEAARRLARRPAGPLVFQNVALFDAEAKTLRQGQTVVVTGNRITAVGPAASVAVPAGAEVVDGRGKTLLPGLWDMHVHAGLFDGVLHLASGVTSVRDLGNDTTTVADLRTKWDAGTALGPRLITSGFIDGPGQYTGPTGLKVATEAEARAAVDTYARLGAEQIKVYSSLDPKLLPVIIEQAHRHGLRVSGHIPWPMVAEQAVRAGVDELQHANFLVLNFLGDTIDTRTPARFNVPARRAAELDLGSQPVRDFVALLKARDVVVDPTLTAFEGMLVARDGEVAPAMVPVVDRFPPDVRRGMKGGGLPVPEGMDERFRASFRKMMEFTALLHRSGVRLVAGTDGMAGFDLHHELELYAEAGIPTTDVLYIATLGAAKVAERDDRLGSVTVGKLADLVLVEGDPVANISDIRRARMVVKDGTVYDPAALYANVNIGPSK
ncbi:MAG TPA: amidohydrolase family protein [Longimicrobium sp.]|nr:amidohydrolase family protein [Longimicrobium sp.]